MKKEPLVSNIPNTAWHCMQIVQSVSKTKSLALFLGLGDCGMENVSSLFFPFPKDVSFHSWSLTAASSGRSQVYKMKQCTAHLQCAKPETGAQDTKKK